jgi:TIR domain/Sel1 repeat
MAHEVFISHSAKDKTIADAVCAMLESEGVRCWIAPRDVTPGMEWGRCIIEAIRQARIMVLVFTSSANASHQIRREVERAVNHDIVILPFRVENVMPDESLEYFIGNVHWLDALTPPLEAHLRSLAGTIKMLLVTKPLREGAEAMQPLGAHAGADPRRSPIEPQPEPPAPNVVATTLPPNAQSNKAAANGDAARPKSQQKRGRAPILILGGAVVLAVVLVVAIMARSGRNRSPAAQTTQALPPAAGTGASSNAPTGPSIGQSAAQPSPGEANRPSASAPSKAPLPALDPDEEAKEADSLIGQKQYAQARPLAQKACDGGVMLGCFNLGWLYNNGWGVAQNYKEAASLYKKACGGGVEAGCFDLGVFFEHGVGVAQNFAQAASLYKQACEGGYAESCAALGGLYRHGDGFAKDEGQAFLLFKRACDSDDPSGCGNVGFDYAYGLGVAKDMATGIQFLKKACSGGNQWSCDRLNELPQ